MEENDQLVDGKEWIGCDNQKCNKWNHVDCEILFNNNQPLKEALEAEDECFKYFCHTCTKAKKASGAKSGKQSAAPKSCLKQVNLGEEI